jgi:hypothetical protein
MRPWRKRSRISFLFSVAARGREPMCREKLMAVLRRPRGEKNASSCAAFVPMDL